MSLAFRRERERVSYKIEETTLLRAQGLQLESTIPDRITATNDINTHNRDRSEHHVLDYTHGQVIYVPRRKIKIPNSKRKPKNKKTRSVYTYTWNTKTKKIKHYIY